CHEFDGDVPYFRLKNAMQAFSDRLESDERVLLAQQIGGDGTLIRWSTREVRSDVGRVGSGSLPGAQEVEAAIRALLTTRVRSTSFAPPASHRMQCSP